MPVPFYFLFKPLWMDFIICNWLGARNWVLLEVFPPKDVERGPKLMESFFSGIAGVVVTIYPLDAYCKGVLTHSFSLELVGDEGNVHFYIRAEKQYRNLIEAQIYAQYPDAEIMEADDYVARFPKVVPNKEWNLWGSDIQLVKEDAYPIKTYDKFEESITGEMLDPMAAITETLTRLTPGQHIWLQFVIRPHLEGWNRDQVHIIEKLAGRNKEKRGGVLNDLMDVLTNLLKALFTPVEFKKDEKKEDQPLEFRLTPVERDVLKAVEDNLGLNSFNTKMRLIYIGRKENFDKSYVSSFFGTLKQFNDLNLNSFKPFDESKTAINYILKERRLRYRQRKIYRRYKDRDMDGKKVVFSTRELATLYHFPDIGVKTPSLVQVESKKGSAPANLPIK